MFSPIPFQETPFFRSVADRRTEGDLTVSGGFFSPDFLKCPVPVLAAEASSPSREASDWENGLTQSFTGPVDDFTALPLLDLSRLANVCCTMLVVART